LAENQIDRLPALAAELVRQQTGGYPPVFAAKAATTTIPIVFLAADDPVRLGLVASLTARRLQLALLAVLHRMPAIYPLRPFAEVGGLMSYGASLANAYRQIGIYAGRILKGAKPADLPVVQSSKFEFIINASTARMLGLNVPDKLLALADEVIE
jgi:ABC-type uncharacterized transport system substrate-binding protein